MKYDYIIIGSGLGGLSCGALLAQSGKKVLILEKHNIVGGLATNFKRKDFEFDVSLHQTGGIYKTFYQNILKKCGVHQRIQWLKHPFLCEIVDANKQVIQVPNGDQLKYMKSLYKRYPKHRIGIWLWFKLMQIFGVQLKIWEHGVSNRLLAPFVMFFAPILAPLVIISHKIKLKVFLNFLIKNPQLKKELLILLGYFGDDCNTVISQNILFAMYGYYFDGGYYAKGGGQAISNAFKQVIEENQGAVKTLKAVDKILTKDQKVTGVQTIRNEIFYADRIICNCDPYQVYEHLLRHTQNKNKFPCLDQLQIGMSCSGAFIGLKCPIEQLNPDYRDAYELFFTDMVVTIHSNLDPNLCPKHHATMDIFLTDYENNWKDLAKPKYKENKERLKELLIKNLSKHFKGIQEQIEVFEVFTPKTITKFTNNKSGAIYGFSQIKNQCGLNRFSMRSKAIKNLYFSSAWSRFGGGYEGAIRNGYYLYHNYLAKKNTLGSYAFYILVWIGIIYLMRA